MSNSLFEEAVPNGNFHLLIGNIPLAMTKLYLDILFLRCCGNLKTKFYYDTNGSFLGFVELVFKEKENADQAYFSFYKSSLLANQLKVELFDGKGRKVQVTPRRICPTPTERGNQISPDSRNEAKIQEQHEDHDDWHSSSSFYSCASPQDRIASPERLSYAEVAKRLEHHEDHWRTVSSLSPRENIVSSTSPSPQAIMNETTKKAILKPHEDVEELKRQLSNLVPTFSPSDQTPYVKGSQPKKGFFKRMSERKKALSQRIQEIEESRSE